MKKVYTAPQILFESFTMSTNIAGNCEAIVGNPTKGTCAVLGTGDIALFDGTMSVCVFTPEAMGGEPDKFDGACYHVPVESNTLFNS